jgi:DinB superfamily
MNKTELHYLLLQNHLAFIQLIQELNEDEFVKVVDSKWAPGQQAEHICKSIAPVALAFRLPKFILQLVFGKANRSSKSYEQLVEKYKQKLQLGGVASGRFIPKEVNYTQKDKIINTLKKETSTLCSFLLKFSEADLDEYILPHPLLGKLTIREMLYFTAYHVQHHTQLVRNIVNPSKNYTDENI